MGPGEAGLESPLVEANGTDEARDSYSRFDVSDSGSPDGDTLPVIKLSR